MSENEPKKPAEGAEPQGLGFSKLAMNEIAPVVTVDPSETGKRTGSAWLIAVVLLAMVISGAWLLKSALNVPPPDALQRQVQEEIGSTQYGRDGTIVSTKFVTGNSMRIEFSPTMNTEDAEQRSVIRTATMDVLKVLVRALPEKDVFLTGFQGDHQMMDAHYLYQSAMRGGQGHGGDDLDAVVSVEHGAGDTMGAVKGSSSRNVGKEPPAPEQLPGTGGPAPK